MSKDTNGMGHRDRAPLIDADDPRINDMIRRSLFADKDAATERTSQLAKNASALLSDLPSNLTALFATFQWLPPFALQFELATKATFHAARATKADLFELPVYHDQLLALAKIIADALATTPNLPHHHHILFDPAQIRRFVASLPIEPSHTTR